MNCSLCQHELKSSIKCPIRFHPTEVIKKTRGLILKDRIMDSDIERYKKIHKQQFFDFDENHVFCSTECCKAFILRNKGEKLYDNSLSFLMYLEQQVTFNSCKTLRT